MSHQVIWTRKALDTFIEEANLSEEDEWIMRTRIAGWSREMQSQKLHISLSTLDKRINRLKKRYDEVQKYNPQLQPRKFSAQELWKGAGSGENIRGDDEDEAIAKGLDD